MSASRSTSLRQLMGLALPLMGSLLSGVAMLVVDGVLCGHIPDNGRSLTALGFAVQIWFLLDVPANVLNIGTVAVASRAFGGGDIERVNRSVAQSCQFAVLIGVVLAVLCAFFSEEMFLVLGASRETADLGADYLRILAIAFPVAFLMDGCLVGALRAVGNTRLPFWCGLAANVVNVVLAYALIFGHFGLPEMGLAGAGIATATARFVSVGLLLAVIRGGTINGLVVRLRATVDRSIAAQIVRVSLPALFEQAAFFGSMTALVWILARIDETSVAAHSIGARVAGLLLAPAFSVSMVSAALVGKALGAHSVTEARTILGLALRATVVLMVPIGVITYVGAAWISGTYDINPGSSLDHYTINWLRIVAVSIILQGILLAFEGLLMGAGASKTVMRINLSVSLLFRITLAAALGFATELGAVGVWLSWPAALCVQLPLAIIAYRRGRWAVTGVTIAK